MTKRKRCARCHGRTKVYKLNGGYSLVDMGGTEVECPLCMGEGYTKILNISEKAQGELNVDKKDKRRVGKKKKEPEK